jgi:hypothetical protein
VFGDPSLKYLGACTFVYASILLKKFSTDPANLQLVQTMSVHRSTDCGHTWEGPFEITGATNPSGGIVSGAPTDAADKEFLDVDPDTGRVVLSWSNFTPASAGGVAISTTYSDNITAPVPTWSTAAVVSATEVDGQASEPAFAGNSSDDLYVAWRQFPGDFTNNVGFAVSHDSGATFGTPVALAPSDFLTMDQVIGNDRTNTSPSIAVDNSRGRRRGTIYVVYGNNDGHDGLDVMFQKSTDRGQTFSAPITLNSSPGHDRAQWFPWISVDKSTGRVWVFFYDQGIATSGDLTETTVTWSDDGGRTWRRPRPLTERPFRAAFGNDTGQPNIGDYNQSVAQNGELFATWAGTHPVGFAEGEPDSVSFPVPELNLKRAAPQNLAPDEATVALGNVSTIDLGQNGNIDPGELVFLKIPLVNYVTNPLNASPLNRLNAFVSTSTPDVLVLLGASNYAEIEPGSSSDNRIPFLFITGNNFKPGTPIELDVNVSQRAGAANRLHHTLLTGTPSATPLFAENFDAVAPGALPAGWTAVHVGGANVVPWTTSSTFCNTGSNAAFHANANDGPVNPGGTTGSPTRFERLSSPLLTIPADAEYVTLEMDVCYDTEDDPNFNILAYDGALLRIFDATAGRKPRSVLVDAFATQFTTGDLQGYPKHFPRSSNRAYFQDMTSWAGDSAGVKHVKMRLPGMAGSTVQLRFEYTQDGGGICSDVRPEHSCGISIDNIVVNSVKSIKPAPR